LRPMSNSRTRTLRRALLLEAGTVVWNIIEGVIAIGAGVVSGSVALIAFGIDSFIETTSALVVGWRLRVELVSAEQETPDVDIEQIETRAARIAGALLLLLALWVTFEAGRRLIGYGEMARESMLGIVLTFISFTIMPFLGRAKMKAAAILNSRALRADGFENIACAWLSLTTLTGLLLNTWFGWWWADPAAALILVPMIVKEGLEGWRGGCDAHE
jgi:cation diffusion facilitator family transporter